MGAPPYALSISHFINSVGADAGFAAIIGLAILILLYFAQARETASLRDRFAEASEQVRQLELRVARLAQGAVQGNAAPVPRPAAAAAPSASRVVRTPLPVAEVPMAPAGVGAPALSAATRVIPSGDEGAIAIRPGAARVAAGVGAAGVGAAVAAGGAAAGAQGPPQASAGGGVMAPPGPSPASGPSGPGPSTAAGAGVASGPPNRPVPANGTNGGSGRIPAPAAAPSGTGAQRRTGAPSSGAPRRPILPPSSPEPQRSWVRGALLLIGGLLLVAAVVVVLVIVTSSGGSSSSLHTATSGPVSNAPSAAKHRRAHAAAIAPASVTVAVLNGTSVNHLAHDVALKLTTAGYKMGNVATATDQTQTQTTVGYLPGHRSAAVIVAKSLNLGTTAIQPVTQANQAVACPAGAACAAKVVVTVGTDLESDAPATTSTAASTG